MGDKVVGRHFTRRAAKGWRRLSGDTRHRSIFRLRDAEVEVLLQESGEQLRPYVLSGGMSLESDDQPTVGRTGYGETARPTLRVAFFLPAENWP